MLCKQLTIEEGMKEPEAAVDEGLCLLPDSSSGSSFSSPSPLMLLQQQASGGDRGPPFFGNRPPQDSPDVGTSPLSPGAFRPLPSGTASPASFVVQQHPTCDQGERLTPLSEVSSSSLDRLTPEDPTLRLRRKRRSVQSSVGSQCSCPVCGVTVRPHELEAHFQQEARQLSKIAKQVSRHVKDHNLAQAALVTQANRQHQRSTSPSSGSPGSSSTSGTCRKDQVDVKASPAARLQLFERVKSNRSGRLSARATRGVDKNCKEAHCPVCQRRLFGTPAQLNAHAEACLRKRGNTFSEDEEVDVEGESSTAHQGEEEEAGEEEEYLWAGQTRLRATSLLQGGYAGCGFTTVRASNEDDEDLNVDGDDTATYGQPQYCESDVIPCGSAAASSEDRALRRALALGPKPLGDISTSDSPPEECRVEPHTTEVTNGVEDEQSEVSGEGRISNGPIEAVEEKPGTDDNSRAAGEAFTQEGTLQTRPCDQRQIVAALHQQIAELRGSQTGMLKCLICMDIYKKPVVSVGCWHVYCEECWLRTLGAKKLCPQCNTITSAGDLRKIYM